MEDKPFYHAVGKEIDIFKIVFENKLPLLLKGPTGTGKSRFVEFMAHELDKWSLNHSSKKWLYFVFG